MIERSVFIACTLLAATILAPPARAQQEPELPEDLEAQLQPERQAEPGEPSNDDEIQRRRAREVSVDEQQRRLDEYIATGRSQISIFKIVDEMVDDFIADTQKLKVAAVSPMAIRSVGVTPNLNAQFKDYVETQLVDAVAKHADLRIKRCIACKSLTTSVDGDEWVVRLGHTTQEQLTREARNLGVVAYIDAFVAYVPSANAVALNVQIYSAQDSEVLWTETYRSDGTTAAILRSGDRVLTRKEARDELVRLIEERPYFGYQVVAGAGVVPFTPPNNATGNAINGIMVGGRLYEKFGQEQRLLFGFHGESFLNFGQNPISGGFVGLMFQYEFSQKSLTKPKYRAGGIAQAFVAGEQGNSFAIEATFDAILQQRFGLSAGVLYFAPVDFAGGRLGGVGGKLRFVLNW
ncbi:MAG: hypothetical protein AAGI01_06110 [Myxococcota bacterium]